MKASRPTQDLSLLTGEGLSEDRQLEVTVEMYPVDDGAILSLQYEVDSREIFSLLNLEQMTAIRDWLSARIETLSPTQGPKP